MSAQQSSTNSPPRLSRAQKLKLRLSVSAAYYAGELGSKDAPLLDTPEQQAFWAGAANADAPDDNDTLLTYYRAGKSATRHERENSVEGLYKINDIAVAEMQHLIAQHLSGTYATVTDIARRAEVPTTSAGRVLQTLARIGIADIERRGDAKRYRIKS